MTNATKTTSRTTPPRRLWKTADLRTWDEIARALGTSKDTARRWERKGLYAPGLIEWERNVPTTNEVALLRWQRKFEAWNANRAKLEPVGGSQS